MFYNDRLSGKQRKQKIALIVCAVVVLAVWLVLTIRINMIFPSKKIEKCGYGEWINYTPDIADIIGNSTGKEVGILNNHGKRAS